MTATRNVYGNVREYDTDLDVFGNVFEWPESGGGAAKTGVEVPFRTRCVAVNSRARLSVVSEKTRTAKVG